MGAKKAGGRQGKVRGADKVSSVLVDTKYNPSPQVFNNGVSSPV